MILERKTGELYIPLINRRPQDYFEMFPITPTTTLWGLFTFVTMVLAPHIGIVSLIIGIYTRHQQHKEYDEQRKLSDKLKKELDYNILKEIQEDGGLTEEEFKELTNYEKA